MNQVCDIAIDAISRHELLLLQRVLSETRGTLKNCVKHLEQYQQEVAALPLKNDSGKYLNRVDRVVHQVKEASWKCIGLEVPIGRSNPKAISLMSALYGDEDLFDRITDGRPRDHDRQALGVWIQKFHELLTNAQNQVSSMYAALTPATRSDLMDAVRDGDDVLDSSSFPNAKALAGNPKGPHPMSPMPSLDAQKTKLDGLKDLPKTAIYATTPLDLQTNEPLPPPTSPTLEKGKKQKFKILVVDDEMGVGLCTHDFIKHMGHLPRLTGNGVEALAALEKESFSAIVSDNRMPKMTGLELYQVVRKRYPHLADKFMFFSGANIDKIAQTGCPVLEKPGSFRELAKMLRTVLGIAK